MEDNIIEGRTERDIWMEFHKTRDLKLRDMIIKQYAPLVKYVAGKISIGMPQNVDFEDLVGFGVFGLFDAIEKFDPHKHVKFKTYAVTRIRGAIFDGLRSGDWVPRSVRQKMREIDQVVHDLESHLGRAATDQEIAKEMNMNIDQFNQVLLKISGTTMLSLDDVWQSSDDKDSVAIVDSIESPSSLRPDMQVEKEEIKRVIAEAIHDLPENEKKVLILYYYEDLTLKEIGKVLEVTESRISQLHTKAIMRLRSKLTNMKKGIF